MKKGSASSMAAVIAVLLAAYGMLYFASVMDGHFKANPDPRYLRTYTAYQWFASPYYRGFPGPLQGAAQWGFAPAHSLDRHLLRPAKWSGPIRFPVAPVPTVRKKDEKQKAVPVRGSAGIKP